MGYKWRTVVRRWLRLAEGFPLPRSSGWLLRTRHGVEHFLRDGAGDKGLHLFLLAFIIPSQTLLLRLVHAVSSELANLIHNPQ